MNTIINLIEKTYYFLWGDWIHLPLPGGTTINLPLLVLLLVPTGIFCTIQTRFLQIRMLPDMLRALLEKAETGHKGGSLSALQALIVSTATRVGMGNLVGIVAALSAGGAGNRAARFGNRFHRGDLSPASQTAGSALRRLPRRSCLLHSRLDQQQTPETGNAGFEEKSSLRTVCALRSDLLVRYQPGHQ